ncbi:unnamed protein product [Prunus brigantina]
MEAQRLYPRIVPKDYTKTAISFEPVLRFFLHRTLPNGKAALRLVGTHNSKPCRRTLAKAKSGSEWVTAQRRTPSFRKHPTSLSNTIVKLSTLAKDGPYQILESLCRSPISPSF